MYKLIVISMIIAVARAGILGGHAIAPLAVAHAPLAVHGATSYQNSNSISLHPVPVAVAHAAPAVAVHAAPAIVAAPAIGLALGHGGFGSGGFGSGGIGYGSGGIALGHGGIGLGHGLLH